MPLPNSTHVTSGLSFLICKLGIQNWSQNYLKSRRSKTHAGQILRTSRTVAAAMNTLVCYIRPFAPSFPWCTWDNSRLKFLGWSALDERDITWPFGRVTEPDGSHALQKKHK